MAMAWEWRNIHNKSLTATYTNSKTKGCELFFWVKSHFVLAPIDGKEEPSDMVADYVISRTGRPATLFSYKYIFIYIYYIFSNTQYKNFAVLWKFKIKLASEKIKKFIELGIVVEPCGVVYVIVLCMLLWHLCYCDMYVIVLCIYCDMYVIVICMLLWHVCYCDMYGSVHVCYCDMYVIVICMLLWYVCYCDVYVIVICMLLWDVCYCELYVIVTCMLLWHVCYCDTYVIAICMLLWHVCYCDMYVIVTRMLLCHVCYCDLYVIRTNKSRKIARLSKGNTNS
jgi:hypothetical protein